MLHRAIINRQLAIWEHIPHLRGEVGCQRANITFVTSLSEIYSNLLRGVKLVLVPDAVSRDLLVLVDYLNHHVVTRIFLVPSLLHAMLEIGITQESLPLLRVWVTAGEAISSSVVGQFKSVFGDATLMNLYGLTEAGSLVHCIHNPLVNVSETEQKSIPIGENLVHISCHIYAYNLFSLRQTYT